MTAYIQRENRRQRRGGEQEQRRLHRLTGILTAREEKRDQESVKVLDGGGKTAKCTNSPGDSSDVE